MGQHPALWLVALLLLSLGRAGAGDQDDPPPPFVDDESNDPVAWKNEPDPQAFTPWMSSPGLQTFLAQYDGPHGAHPNYWDRGHWINAVEGRWANNEVEFRIAYGRVPPHSHYGWYWYLGISPGYFASLSTKMAAEGFTLLDPNSFTDPGGQVRCQAVWHKLTP